MSFELWALSFPPLIRFHRKVCVCACGCEAAGVQESESVQCPFCGQSFELLLDTSVTSQRFTTDCEVCCRPFEVAVECEPGEVLSVEVLGG